MQCFPTCFPTVFLSTIGISGNPGNKRSLLPFVLPKGALKLTSWGVETQAGDQAASSLCPEGGTEQPLRVGRRRLNFRQARRGGDYWSLGFEW